MSNVHVASPVRRNGEVRCFSHSETVLERKLSHTEGNPNRRAFYCCEVVVSDGQDGMRQCNFFKWEDELPMPSSQSSQASSTSQSTPVTPSKRPASALVHELSPAQKRLNASSQTPTRSPASQARLDAILRAQNAPATEASTSATTSSALRASGSASPSPSHTAAPPTSQTSPTLPSWFSAQPSATSFRPSTPPPTAERTERHWNPTTPPTRRSIEQSEDVSRTRNENSNGPRNGIRSSVLGASGEVRLDDPFIFPSGSATSSGDSEPRGPVASSSLAESESADAESAADELGIMANRLAQFPEYISKLERRLTAAEKSNNAKAQKMERMQEEIDRLKAQNAELQRNLAQRP